MNGLLRGKAYLHSHWIFVIHHLQEHRWSPPRGHRRSRSRNDCPVLQSWYKYTIFKTTWSVCNGNNFYNAETSSSNIKTTATVIVCLYWCQDFIGVIDNPPNIDADRADEEEEVESQHHILQVWLFDFCWLSNSRPGIDSWLCLFLCWMEWKIYLQHLLRFHTHWFSKSVGIDSLERLILRHKMWPILSLSLPLSLSTLRIL